MAAVLGSAGTQFEGLQGVLYDVYIKSPLLSGVLGRLQWGSGGRAMRAHMERAVRSVPADTVETVLADASALPFDSGSADVVMAYNGLHHFADPQGSLREATRHRHFRRHAKVNVHLTRS